MKPLILLLSVLVAGCSHMPNEPTTATDANTQDMVVLIHGFGRSNFAMWKMQERLEQAGYHVEAIGYASFTQDMDGIVGEITEKINSLTMQDFENVHFVGHSLGGLLVRSYLGNHSPENLGNVVMLGSPNKGTPVVDYLKDEWWFALAGPAVHAMSTEGTEFLSSLKPPTYPLGVIAGNQENSNYESVLVGNDDGLVPLESTKVLGMTDFTIVDSGHSMLRYNLEAAMETLHFLQHSEFRNTKKPG